MDTKHTPGPWHRNISPAGRYPTIYAGRNKHVAQLVIGGIDADALEGNADLIAAAPELLTALVQLEALASRLVGPEATYYELTEARAAIAKATGAA